MIAFTFGKSTVTCISFLLARGAGSRNVDNIPDEIGSFFVESIFLAATFVQIGMGNIDLDRIDTRFNSI